MLRKVALGFGVLKALEWLGDHLSNGITIKALPIQRGDVKLFKESLRLRLVVTNRNRIPLTIKSVVGNFYQGSQLLKPINMQNVIKVNGGTSKELLFEMHLNLDTTLKNLADALSNGCVLQPITFKGNVNANGINLPITRTFELLKTA